MKWLYDISRWIFPTWCELCGRGGDHIVCPQCEEEELLKMDAPYCLTCSEKFFGVGPQLQDCHYCRDVDFAFDYIVAAYQVNAPLAKLIHALKYNRALYLAPFLSDRMRLALLDKRLEQLNLADWTITPVPLHFTRQRHRYFNQSHLLAHALATEVNVDCQQLLTRIKPTSQQVRLSKAQRAKNVANAFQLSTNLASLPEQVILVDDVFTTGATINACAKVLKKHGVKRIIAICLARK